MEVGIWADFLDFEGIFGKIGGQLIVKAVLYALFYVILLIFHHFFGFEVTIITLLLIIIAKMG